MAFSCKDCNKTFKGAHILYSHKIRKRPCSSCQYCGQRFDGRKDIRSHMKSNHLDFPCSICTSRFFLSTARDTHTRAKHGSISRHLDDVTEALQPTIIYSRTNPAIQHGHHLNDMNRHTTSTSQTTWFQNRDGELNTKFLSDVRSCGSLDKLLVNKIYPESDKTKTRNKIVNYLSKIMQHNTPSRYSTPGVFKARDKTGIMCIKSVGESSFCIPCKGGSSGKGTSIEAKTDLDLLVKINAYSSVAQLQRNMDTVLKDLRDLIEKNAHFASRIHFTRYTSHSIRFGVRVDPGDEMTEVDLLPAVDLGYGNRKHIFDQMKGLSNRDRSFYSVSFSKDQVEFVDQAPGAKDLIRVVKHWKKRENIGLDSYCIELIVVKQWMDGKLTGSLAQGLKQVMGEISRLSSMRITWPSRYNISQYGGLPSPPAVMDPANPFINTAEGVRDVATTERKAKEILNRM